MCAWRAQTGKSSNACSAYRHLDSQSPKQGQATAVKHGSWRHPLLLSSYKVEIECPTQQSFKNKHPFRRQPWTSGLSYISFLSVSLLDEERTVLIFMFFKLNHILRSSPKSVVKQIAMRLQIPESRGACSPVLAVQSQRLYLLCLPRSM